MSQTTTKEVSWLPAAGKSKYRWREALERCPLVHVITKTVCPPPPDFEPWPRFSLIISLHKDPKPDIRILKRRTEATQIFQMCKSADIHGFHRADHDRLKIRGFYLRLSVFDSNKPVPDSLTLVYLPRINGSPLEVADSKIRPDSAAFVTLHRIISADAVFASRERVRASESTRFEVYTREEKVLKGIFRKDEKDEWKMECRCALESGSTGVTVSAAEVCVAVEGHVAMSETVEMAVRRKAKARAIQQLEEIPEEREVETESHGCYCFCGEDEDDDYESDDGNCEVNGREMEMDMEGFGWAVDLGIWVMCLGVGYLLSRASSKNLRRSIL